LNLHTTTERDIENLERLAALLEESGEYRVLRRLRPRSLSKLQAVGAVRRGLFVDVETTGLNPAADEIVELAMIAFDYVVDGSLLNVIGSFDQLRYPGRPIPPEVSRLTGLTDEMVAMTSIDDDAVAEFVAPAALVVAHNAAFDRKFCERLFPIFAEKPWACTFREVAWADEGFESARLSILANGYGLFFDGHRALNDCQAAVELLARPLPRSGKTGLAAILESARRACWRIRAVGAPFSCRETLKLRKYHWDTGDRRRHGAWYLDVPEEAFEAECEFLREQIYRRKDAAIEARLLTAYERYSDREDSG
jgi:DNA polymerase-3 subunit epsilon